MHTTIICGFVAHGDDKLYETVRDELTIAVNTFLSRISTAMLTLTRDIDIAILSVRLSVRPSVCRSRSGIVLKLLHISSYVLQHIVAQSF